MTRVSKTTRRGFLAAGAGALGLAPMHAHAGLLEDILEAVTKGDTGSSGSLSQADAAAGLREALIVGTGRVVSRVGRLDGYFGDNLIRIPLPGFLSTAQSALRAVGQSAMLDDLELRLNRAAETAAPIAKSIFIDAIKAMTVQDAIGIVRGSDTAATDYFRGKMTPPLTNAFRPVVKNELKDAGALRSFDRLAERYEDIPLVPALQDSAKDDLITHGLEGALHGLFYYLGKEEAAIRNDPAKRTSEILRKVFKLAQ